MQNDPLVVLRALAAFGDRLRMILIIDVETGKKKIEEEFFLRAVLDVSQIIKRRGGSGCFWFIYACMTS